MIGLIPGKVNASSELRLRQGIIENDNISKMNKDTNSSNMEASVSKLVELVAGDEGLIQLRGDVGDLYLLHTFINNCLFHFCTSMNW